VSSQIAYKVVFEVGVKNSGRATNPLFVEDHPIKVKPFLDIGRVVAPADCRPTFPGNLIEFFESSKYLIGAGALPNSAPFLSNSMIHIVVGFVDVTFGCAVEDEDGDDHAAVKVMLLVLTV
jgi:hypothetical protein